MSKPKGKRGRPLGHKLSAETKAKIAEARMGKKHSENTKKKIKKSLDNYFKENHEYSEPPKTLCERCGKEVVSKNYIPRKMCDDCVNIIRANNDKLYKSVYQKLRKNKEYIGWRQSILERDDNTCVICKGEADSVHHLINLVDIIDKPEILYSQDIGISLCKSCHGKLHYKMKYVGQE